TVKAECVRGHTEVTLSQQRYFADRDKLEAGSPELWQVPICLKTPGANGPACEVLADKKQTFQLNGCAPWVFANATGRGYYHASYDSDMVKKLSAVAETALTPEERISFLSDSWAMASVGREPIGDYLTIISGLKSDRTRAVMESMLAHLSQIHEFVISPSGKPAFEAWTRQ